MKKETIIELIGLALENKPAVTINSKSPFEIGKKYFIRTVTLYMVGEVVDIKGNFIIFKSASWIADTGRFADFIKSGEADEVEPINATYGVATTAVVDFVEWNHSLPNNQK